jgi:hypothetical protein
MIPPLPTFVATTGTSGERLLTLAPRLTEDGHRDTGEQLARPMEPVLRRTANLRAAPDILVGAVWLALGAVLREETGFGKRLLTRRRLRGSTHSLGGEAQITATIWAGENRFVPSRRYPAFLRTGAGRCHWDHRQLVGAQPRHQAFLTATAFTSTCRNIRRPIVDPAPGK